MPTFYKTDRHAIHALSHFTLSQKQFSVFADISRTVKYYPVKKLNEEGMSFCLILQLMKKNEGCVAETTGF